MRQRAPDIDEDKWIPAFAGMTGRRTVF